MRLLRLLAAGKSLVGLKDSGTRYRDLGPQALPRFGGKKKLLRPSGQLMNAASETAAKPAALAEIPAAETKPEPPPRKSDQPKTWRAKWQALWRPRSSSGIPHFDKAPVQTELSLDRVKVVRNDLSDSDLEVVPARTSAATTGAASAPAKSRTADTEAPAATSAKQGDLLICK